MSTKKEESIHKEPRENPKQEWIIPGDSDTGKRDRGILGEIYGDVRKGQKPRKLED
ncbi:MAG: hypothetical protein ABIS20_19130 [Thermoanaerobaculia bacterium]